MRNDELTNIDIVLYALFRLGGHNHKVHTEEVAYESYKLAKDRFGWRLPKFREMDFPDKDPIRVSLTDAAKEKYGSLVHPTGARLVGIVQIKSRPPGVLTQISYVAAVSKLALPIFLFKKPATLDMCSGRAHHHPDIDATLPE